VSFGDLGFLAMAVLLLLQAVEHILHSYYAPFAAVFQVFPHGAGKKLIYLDLLAAARI
jgi:hypothetical protein